MSLTYGFNSARDLFMKLQRDAAALHEEVTSDRFFNFVVTGYSLNDWLQNDPTVPASKADVRALYADKWLQVCRDLANGSKHFTITKYAPMTESAVSNSGYGFGRYGKSAYGVGEESIQIQLNDGTSFDCLHLAREVLTVLKDFFSAHGI